MSATTYPLPRGADGRILIDDSALRDDEPREEAPPAGAAAAGSAAPPPPPSAGPRRSSGEAPTPFSQLRPGASAGGAPLPAERWRLILAWVAALAILGGTAYALLIAPPGTAPTASRAAATAAAGEASPVAASSPAGPTVTATPAAELTRAIVVFDVPNGTPVGALEPGRAYTLIGEQGDWRQLDVPGSGKVWARAWEIDGEAPPEPTVLPTAAPAPPPPAVSAPAPRPAAPAPAVVPVGPAVTCMPVVDADNGNRYLGDACGATSEARQAEALRLLQAAPPPTLSGGQP